MKRTRKTNDKKTIGAYVDTWLYDLINTKARAKGKSTSAFIGDILRELFTSNYPERMNTNLGYYNDSKGILRSVNKQ